MKLILFVFVLLWLNLFWLTLFNKISLFNFWYLLVQLNSFLSIMLMIKYFPWLKYFQVLALRGLLTDWLAGGSQCWWWWRVVGGTGPPLLECDLRWGDIQSRILFRHYLPLGSYVRSHRRAKFKPQSEIDSSCHTGRWNVLTAENQKKKEDRNQPPYILLARVQQGCEISKYFTEKLILLPPPPPLRPGD